MMTPRLKAAALLGALVTAAAAVASDQEGEKRAQLISVKYPGGTVTGYVDIIKRAAEDVNIVVAPEAREVQMPPVSLNQVTVAAALDLLDDRSQQQPGRAVKLSVRHLPKYDERELQTYQVRAHVFGRPSETQAHVWTVAHLLDNDVTSDAVLAAVETALEVVGSATRLDVRFHEETGLLIAAGDESQIAAIAEVLDRLNDSVEQRREDPLRRLESALESATEQHHGVLAQLQRERERLEVRAVELQHMLDSRERELAQAMARIRALEVELERQHQRGSQRRQPDG